MKKKVIMFLYIALVAIVIVGVILKFFLINCCESRLSDKDLARFERSAQEGNLESIKKLRFHFEDQEKFDKAFIWLERGASLGDPQSEYHLADILLRKENSRDRERGIKYLTSAAIHGEPTAQTVLGENYRDGRIVHKDLALAIHWLKEATKSGSSDGAIMLVDILISKARSQEEYFECLYWNSKGLELVPAKPGGAARDDLERQRVRIFAQAKSVGIIVSG